MLRRTLPLLMAAFIGAAAFLAAAATETRADDGANRGGPAEVQARHPGVVLYARLHGSEDFPRAHGIAKFASRDGEFHLGIGISNVPRLAGTRVDFYVGERHVGTASVNRHGSAAVRMAGHGDFNPAGMRVTVTTAHGLLVAGGAFPNR